MAEIQQTQTLPAPFIQAAAEQYFPQLAEAVGGIKGLDVSKLLGPQFVAGTSPLQQQAEQLATGLGGYQPYLQAAQAATDLSRRRFASGFRRLRVCRTIRRGGSWRCPIGPRSSLR